MWSARFRTLRGRAEAADRGLEDRRPEDDDTKLGPLISKEHQAKVLSYYQLAVQEGATVVTGGGVPDLAPSMRTAPGCSPPSGPACPRRHASSRKRSSALLPHRPFDTEEEVLTKANDNVYGLASAVWTQDLARAHRVAQRMHVGMSWVNSWFLRDLRTPLAVPSNRASAARACIRWSSTPS
jgi:aminomuconate-semialdehyde/2-hydroxymuconate-6-semialdehyde dehydrogenase